MTAVNAAPTVNTAVNATTQVEGLGTVTRTSASQIQIGTQTFAAPTVVGQSTTHTTATGEVVDWPTTVGAAKV